MDIENKFNELYGKNLDKNNVFQSISYEITQKRILDRELKKTHYIQDLAERTTTAQQILKENNTTELITDSQIQAYKMAFIRTNGTEKYKEPKHFIYGATVHISYVRSLEVMNYVKSLFAEAQKHINENKKRYAINYLINNQFKWHTKVLASPKHDLKYSQEYNRIIFELLQTQINEIAEFKHPQINESITNTLKAKLVWNAKKGALGTLFGALHDAGIIQGSKTDTAKALTSMFTNISKSYVKNNINSVSAPVDEFKTRHDIDTLKFTKGWIDYLKKSP